MKTLVSLLLVAALFSGCNKHKDSTSTQSGGGNSTQSLVTLKGAAQ